MEREDFSPPINDISSFQWVISLRWMGLLSSFILISIVRVFIQFDYIQIIILGAVASGLNFLSTTHLRRYRNLGPVYFPQEIRIIAQLQLFIDLLILAWLMRITGGIESPFIPLFLTSLPLVGMVHSRRFTLASAGIAVSLIWGITLLEYYSIIPHMHFGKFYTDELLFDNTFAILVILSVQTLLIFLIAITSGYVGGKFKSVVDKERRQRQQAEAQQKMSADLSSTLDLYKALYIVKQHVLELIPYDYFVIAVNLGERFQSVTDFKTNHAGLKTITEGHLRIIFQEIVESGFDSYFDPSLWKALGIADIDNSYGTLLTVRGQPIGLLAVGAREKGVFTHIEIDMLQWITDRITLVLDNIYLYKQTLTLAHTDPLTELYNMRRFVEILEQETKRAHRYNIPLSLLIVDLDHFKKFNDLHGHLAGDDLLKELAILFNDHARESDTVARYGGEEFIFLLPETNITQAKEVAERLRATIENHEFFLSAEIGPTKITISIGATAITSPENTPKDLIKTADDALYKAKIWRNKVFSSEDPLPPKKKQAA